MALVRKTPKIWGEISTNIDALISRKCKKTIKNQDTKEVLEKLVPLALRASMSSEQWEFFKTCKDPEINSKFGFQPIRAKGKFDGVPVENSIFNLDLNFGIIAPPFIKGGFCLYSPGKYGLFLGLDSGGYENCFVNILVIPRFKDKFQFGSSIPIDNNIFSTSINNHLKNMAIEITDKSVTLELKRILETYDQIYHNLLKSISKFEETRQYIFTELWKLPSVNKMIEFFPNLKALLNDETVERYMRGSTKKKEYGVVAPPPSVVASTVVANMNEEDDED